MVDRDVVLAKADVIDHSIRRIRDLRKGDRLEPLDVEEITLLNLQRAVQATLDIASHIVASEGLGLPDSLASAFSLLERNGIIDSPMSGRLRRMVGFRNILIHNYQTVDLEIVEDIAENRLEDLTSFVQVVLKRFDLSEPKAD